MHIGALPSLYNLHITLLLYQVFVAVAGEKLRVDIDNSAIRYYSGFFFFSFYFVYTSACNLVFVFVRVIAVTVSVCEDGVKLNYFRSILNQKEPYTDFAENKEKHTKEI